MQVVSANKNLAKAAGSASEARRIYGADVGKALGLRVKQLMSANRISDLTSSTGKWGPKKGSMKGQYGAHVTPNYRLMVSFSDDETVADLIDIIDYH